VHPLFRHDKLPKEFPQRQIPELRSAQTDTAGVEVDFPPVPRLRV
jgi:hypothetical protein